MTVSPEHVFKDPNRSAWQRDRKRSGWDRLLELAGAKKIRHVVPYHPDRLMRQPKDLEKLITIADDHDITLHGQANQRDLADPNDRFFLRTKWGADPLVARGEGHVPDTWRQKMCGAHSGRRWSGCVRSRSCAFAAGDRADGPVISGV